MSFTLDLKAITDKATEAVNEVIGGVVADLAKSVDYRSPVGDAAYWKSKPPAGYVGGHFRGNWQLGVDVRPVSELPGVDRGGGETLGRIYAAIPEETAGHVFWLANNVPYAQALEHGHSRQAPTGIVGLAATEFQQIVRDRAAQMGGTV